MRFDTHYSLKVKNAFVITWRLRPWLLAGLAHASPTQARHIAQQCLQQWESTAEHLHHKVSREFLHPAGVLRKEVDRFASGTPLEQLTPVARQRIASLKFMPVVERLIEATHKNMKMAGGHHRAGPMSLSNAVRSQVVLENMLTLAMRDGQDKAATVSDLVPAKIAIRCVPRSRTPDTKTCSDCVQRVSSEQVLANAPGM